MHISGLVPNPKMIVSAWRSLFPKAEIDRGYDAYERAPVNRYEISALLDLHYRKVDPRGFSERERRDHENLSALRESLYPPSAA